MHMSRKLAVLLLLALSAAGVSAGAVITFEGAAPAGGYLDVDPDTPYTEAGFTLTPLFNMSGVWDAAGAFHFPGDPTSWFIFMEGNTITLTGPVPFSLDSAVVGPSPLDDSISVTITGYLVGGGTVSVTFDDLTTATSEVIGFANLQSATFDASGGTDGGLDDIVLTGSAVPEPSTCLLLFTGLLALTALRRKPV
jgi:hypothetical protein